jgi:leucyl aminopeptidase
MRFSRYFFIVAAIAVMAVSALLFSGQFSRTQADKHDFWITIDEQELKTVQQDALQSGIDLGLEVKSIQNGIAIVYTSNGDLERLSGEMHKHFNKCAGFIAHQSEAEARQAIAAMSSNLGTQKLIDYVINNDVNVNQLLPETQEIKVRETIQELSAFLTRRHDQPTALQSAAHIKTKWETLTAGRNDITVEYFNHQTTLTPQPSVILTIQGTTLPNEVVVLGGHQDSIRSGTTTGSAPGADDDASGIASLTEAIRVIAIKNFRPQRTVKFMAYSAEEVGLRGSNDIAANYLNNGVNVVGVVQMDMTNFKGNPSFDFAFESDTRFINAAQTQFLKDLVTHYLPTLNYTNSQCNYGCSDHTSWHNRGFPASFPFEAPFGQHNSAIHTTNDTIARSDNMAVHAEKFSKLALTFVGEVAKGEIPSIAPENQAPFDFDGDNKTDISIFRPSVGQWWYLKSSNGGNAAFNFGQSTDLLAPGDFTGDGKADITFFRPTDGSWYILRSEDSSFFSFPFGASGDIPIPADFDGDGKVDPTVFRPSTATWFISRSSDNGTTIQGFGLNGDKPVVADYDGDGKADLAIFRPSNGQWWFQKSSNGQVTALQFGTSTDRPIQGDYTGDRKADIGFWRPSTGEWFILRSEDTSFFSFPFGTVGDIPAPGDYDGDGRIDPAVFRPSSNTWFINRTTSGLLIAGFGLNGDHPIPAAFVP